MLVTDRETNWADRRLLFLGNLRAIWNNRRSFVLQFLVVFSLGLMIFVARGRNYVMLSASTLVGMVTGVSVLTSLIFTYFDSSTYGFRELTGLGVAVREVDFTVVKTVRVTFDRVYSGLVLFELPHGGVVCLSESDLPAGFQFTSRLRIRKFLPGTVFSVESIGEPVSLDLFLTLNADEVDLVDLPLSGEVLPGLAEDVVARLHRRKA